jgi:hypothetical protein
MATQLMKDWIVELHNPERKQVVGYLGRVNREGVKFNCCLGVLCEVKGIAPKPRKEIDETFTLAYNGQTGMPGDDVLIDVLGLPEGYSPFSVDLYEDDDDIISADEANDTYGLTFKQIAEKLEEKYLNEEEQFEVRKRIEDLGWA